ncbi:hypothetical protein BH09MYX1_BH09MYX1_11370 [soil metagenome]
MPRKPHEKDATLWKRLLSWARALVEAPARAKKTPRRTTRPTTVRRTRQIADSDCGIAALSMLADVSYRVARRALFRPRERCRGTSHVRMKAGLDALNIGHAARFRKFISWDDIPSHALVGIRWKDSSRADLGHWVVYQKLENGYRVLDPASFAQTLSAADVSPMVGESFLIVQVPDRRPERPRKPPAHEPSTT